jgi:uncharacterized protein DUF4386
MICLSDQVARAGVFTNLSHRLPRVPGVTVAVAQPSPRMTAVAYLAYFVIAGIGQALALQDPASALAPALQVGGTIWYGIVALLLCRLFGDPTRGVGVLAMVSAVVGCVIQSLYFALALGRGAEVFALASFGLFLVFVGYLVVRSALIPRAIGVALIVGGAASCVLWLPFVPAALAPAFVLGGVAEFVLFLWLLVKGVRR